MKRWVRMAGPMDLTGGMTGDARVAYKEPVFLSVQAVALYLRASETGLEDTEMLHCLADSAFRSGQHALARRSLERALIRSPRHVPVMVKLMKVGNGSLQETMECN